MATKGNRPLDEVTEEREREAWLLRQQGWSQARIALRLGISQQAVSKMLGKLGGKLATEFKKRAEVIKAEHTEMLERIADQALQEWEASKAQLVKTSVKTGIQKVQAVSHQDGKSRSTSYEVVDLDDETTVTTENRNGDPRYLGEARGALAEIRTIWGANAPQKTEVETKHSGNLTFNSPTLEKAAQEHSTWREQMLEQLKAAREQSQKTLGEMPMSSETDE